MLKFHNTAHEFIRYVDTEDPGTKVPAHFYLGSLCTQPLLVTFYTHALGLRQYRYI
jgi:hypothetical protein